MELPGTRERVLDSLLREGPATAATLADRLGLTAPAVRRHLDGLAADGLVEDRERPPYGPIGKRGRGRPARYFALTDAGRGLFPDAYDDLAAAALRALHRLAGDAAVAEFARDRAADLADRYAASVTATDLPQRAEQLAKALSEDGYAASADTGGHGVQLCQHHCPVAHVAAEFPQLCEAETDAFAALLDTHVQRLATIAHGDHLCTTHVPAAPVNRRTAS
jgi:predicted ArsR family transcriptional regulator